MSDFDPDIPVVEQLVTYPTMKRLIDQMLHGVFILNHAGQVQYANVIWERTIGRHYSDFETEDWINAFDPTEQRRIKTAFKQLRKTGQRFTMETVVRRHDDSQRLVKLAVSAFADENGGDAFLGTLEDYTTQFQLAQAADENERRLSIMLEVMSEGVVLQDAKGQIIVSNPAAEQILGLTADQMMGRTSTDPRWSSIREDGSDFPGEQHPTMRTLATGEHLSNQMMGVHKPDGTLTWISINSVPLHDGVHSQPYAVVASFSDVTELKVARDELSKKLDALHIVQVELEMRQRELLETNNQLRLMADTDVLTGLKNRRSLYERLTAEAALADRNNSTFSVAILDIDHFKAINDTHGHAAGDEVLKRVAEALRSCARLSDYVARYGGEEFAIIMPHTNREQAEQFIARVLNEIRRIHWHGKQVTSSAGVAVYGPGTVSLDQLIDEADKALYRAKEAGRNQSMTAA